MLCLTSHSFLFVSPLRPSASRRFPPSTRPNSARDFMARPSPEFPYLPPANRALLLDLLATINNRLGAVLLPSTVLPDVLSFRHPENPAHGSVDIRSGSESSPVDFVLQYWLHCKIPDGSGEINIATLLGFLDSSTDAPHLLIELIQGSPASLAVFMDLLPRKDLVLHPAYLDEFYQKTDLDSPRRDLEGIPQSSPYRSSSLFIRSIFSPTAVVVSIECGKESEAAVMEEIVAGRISGAAKKIVEVWLEKCVGGEGRRVANDERVELERRDGMLKRKVVEIDLVANLPRMFGPEVAERVVAEIQKAFRV